MIDKIVDLICEEARRREGWDLSIKLLEVVVEVDTEISKIILNLETLGRSSHKNPKGKRGEQYLIRRAYR